MQVTTTPTTRKAGERAGCSPMERDQRGTKASRRLERQIAESGRMREAERARSKSTQPEQLLGLAYARQQLGRDARSLSTDEWVEVVDILEAALYKAGQERADLGKRFKVVSDSLLAVKRDLVRVKLDARCNEIERESFERELKRLQNEIERMRAANIKLAEIAARKPELPDPDESGFA